MGGTIGSVKVRKLLGWDKDCLIGKATCASKAKREINSLHPINRQAFSHLRESRAPSHVDGYLGRQTGNSKCPLSPSSSPSFYCSAWHHMVWNSPLVSWAQLSQLCPLPNFPCSPAHLLVGQGKQQTRFWLSKRCSAIMKTSPCYQHCFQNKSKT